MNAPQKTDFAYFRNEILSDIKGMENKINEKIADIYKYLERINSDNEQKLGIINNKIKNIKENDSTSLEEKLNSKYEKINNKLDEKISTLSAKINMVKKDLSDACFRYDKIIIDNLKVTGLIGEGCTFTNLKNFIEFIYKNITEISVAKEKIVNEIKLVKIKLDDIKTQFKSDFENQKFIINDMLAIRLRNEEKKNLERNFALEKQMENLKLDNYNLSNNLIKKMEELQIQYEKLENVNNELNEKINEDIKSFRINIDNLGNDFNTQNKEFNLIKSRFAEMSDNFKELPTRRLSSNFGTLELSKKLNFNKQQVFKNNEEKKLKLELEENNSNNERIKENKIKTSDNQNKDDSNYINNINLNQNSIDIVGEDKKEGKEGGINLEKYNKNNRKNNVNDNNSNNIDSKNKYTKIAIKSVYRKSKNDSINNLNEYNNKEKEKDFKEITFEPIFKNEGRSYFYKTLSKNIFFHKKKINNSLKKIIFNNSKESKETKDNSLTFLSKKDRRKLLLKKENEKFQGFLSSSNEFQTINHHRSNISPLNLKFKNSFQKKDNKINDEISQLNLDYFLSQKNTIKENEIYENIFKYINQINNNINKSIQDLSNNIFKDISSIKKEINQIYNDANLINLNNSNSIKKLAPFPMKINNFDLYNNSGIQLNMENFKKNVSKLTFAKNKIKDKNFNCDNLNNKLDILRYIEPYLIKKFAEKATN